jgi:hypothetical protein
MVSGRVTFTDGLAFGLSKSMARDLADVGVVVSRYADKPEPAAPYVAWKPTPGDTEPPF